MSARLFDEFRRVVYAHDEAAALDRFFAARAEFLVPTRAAHGELQASALDRWAEAFDWLDLMILSSAEVVRRHEERVLGAGQGDWDVTALHYIFWSGQTVAGEVLALLRAGYGTGALARWRALHEAATRAEFIVHACARPAEAARRYLQHEEYRNRRELAILQGWIRKASPEHAIPPEAMKAMAAEDDEVIGEHGEIFRTEYGWAHEELLGTSQEYADL
jgi:hypothetical protein